MNKCKQCGSEGTHPTKYANTLMDLCETCDPYYMKKDIDLLMKSIKKIEILAKSAIRKRSSHEDAIWKVLEEAQKTMNLYETPIEEREGDTGSRARTATELILGQVIEEVTEDG